MPKNTPRGNELAPFLDTIKNDLKRREGRHWKRRLAEAMQQTEINRHGAAMELRSYIDTLDRVFSKHSCNAGTLELLVFSAGFQLCLKRIKP